MNTASELRIAFAGDRDISVRVLRHILVHNVEPLALLVPDSRDASHSEQLIRICPFLPVDRIFVGAQFRRSSSISLLRQLNLDLLIAVHFPLIVPPEVLSIPRHGVVNLHPAYLPFNRGWHTPSWAILEGTPIGATLHFMDQGIDTGDIVHQKRMDILPTDTAHTLYQRLKELEFEVFQEAWPQLLTGIFHRTAQQPAAGTVHKRRDLLQDEIRLIDLDMDIRAGDLLTKLRALTTDRRNESALFEIDGRRYGIQVTIYEE